MQDKIIRSRKHFEADAVMEQFDEVMDFVESTLRVWEVEKLWVEKICLLVDEVVMNIIRYAYPDSVGRVHISILHTHNAIQVDVKDTGIPFDPTMYPDPDVSLPLEQRPVGGLGIHFMRRMLDVFQYRRMGMYNHLIMKLSTGSKGSAFEQVNLIDDEDAVLNVLIAVSSETLREAVRVELTCGHYHTEYVESVKQLEEVINRGDAGIQLVIIEQDMVNTDLSTYAHRLKTRQQVPYVYVTLLTRDKDVSFDRMDTSIDDYLVVPFESTAFQRHADIATKTLDYEERLLRQRLAHRESLGNLAEWQNSVVAELAEAAEYIQSLLPPAVDDPVRIRWRFTPRSFLGGDLFSYQWLDDQHMAIYLMDSCGHGFRAALFAIAVQNMMMSRILPGLDRCDPSVILANLNRAFPMDRFNNMYFSMWAGIYHRHTNRLYFSSGGHPPAILLRSGEVGGDAVEYLTTAGMALGCYKEAFYETQEVTLRPDDRLYIYTDGLIENSRSDGGNWTRPELAEILQKYVREDREDELLNQITRELYKGQMEDDFCLLSVRF